MFVFSMRGARWVGAAAVLGLAAWASVRPAVTPPTLLARASANVTLRVATYNVRNYNIQPSRTVDGQYRPNWPKPESEKTALRAVIRAAHPDVLALQEMGDAPFLAELQRDLATEGLAYPYSLLVQGPDPDRHVAVLSRVPFADTHAYTQVAYKLNGQVELAKRGLLEADFVTNGQPWALYAVHLKSRLTEADDPGDPASVALRDGEAQAIRDLIRKQQPLATGALVAVVGDFNDSKDSAPVRRFLELDGKPLLRLAPAADSRGEVWTLSYPKADQYERGDFILFSAALAEWQNGPGGVVDIPAATDASDHRLVWVDLVFPAKTDQPATAPAPANSTANITTAVGAPQL